MTPCAINLEAGTLFRRVGQFDEGVGQLDATDEQLEPFGNPLVRPVEVPRLVGDPGQLIAATGWAPRFTLDETLDAVLADARTRAQGS